VFFVVRKTISELECAILATLFLPVQKALIVGVPGRRIYSVLFFYTFQWFPSSIIAVAANGDCLTCGGFSLDEIVHLGNFEFIIDYFSGLSLSRGGAPQVSFSWAQLAARHHPHGGP
jgi:hypothetical protein